MKMFLISDNIDTQIGMRFAGVEGVVVHEADEVRFQLTKAVADKEIGIVIITIKLSQLVNDMVCDIKMNYNRPLIVEIPDRHGMGKPVDFIADYIRDAIGVKL